ncbi:MAG: hypothetical protein Q8L93_06855 [Rhodocyclaceae bacterium]|nr:hypothetical protein [Rhodocyclaceae bacterium]
MKKTAFYGCPRGISLPVPQVPCRFYSRAFDLGSPMCRLPSTQQAPTPIGCLVFKDHSPPQQREGRIIRIGKTPSTITLKYL